MTQRKVCGWVETFFCPPLSGAGIRVHKALDSMVLYLGCLLRGQIVLTPLTIDIREGTGKPVWLKYYIQEGLKFHAECNSFSYCCFGNS